MSGKEKSKTGPLGEVVKTSLKNALFWLKNRENEVSAFRELFYCSARLADFKIMALSGLDVEKHLVFWENRIKAVSQRIEAF